MRAQFTNDLKEAMKAGQKRRVDTIRLITSALKDKDIEARTTGKPMGDDEIRALLQKMVKSRQESLGIFEAAGREDLALIEREEIEIISRYLPKQMDEADVTAAITAAIAETGAASIKDMGKVVGSLKARFSGQMDFSKASAQIKALLG